MNDITARIHQRKGAALKRHKAFMKKMTEPIMIDRLATVDKIFINQFGETTIALSDGNHLYFSKDYAVRTSSPLEPSEESGRG